MRSMQGSALAALVLGRSSEHRDVAQLGSALDWGSRGREFESRRPDRKDAGQLCYRKRKASPLRPRDTQSDTQ